MTTIGRYEVVGELGRGGWGVVYRAIDPGLGRTVAIKTIRANNDDKEIRERFHREARTAGMLSHPNIVTVYEFSDTGDVMFIAMEYIDGQTLAQRMGEGRLPLDFTLAMARAASEALDFAHAHNIVHRDVKPGNFMISKDGRLKMADFGIAKILDSEVGLTSTGIVIGTAQYMSPEQIAAKEVTGRSDQFSLAVIAYEMLTGHRPFQGNSWASIMHAIISSEPPPLSEYRKELGDEATLVLRKGLAKDPLERYPSCKGLVDALDHALLGPTAERPSYWAVTGKIPMDPPTESMAGAPARPKTSSHTERPVSEETETMYVPPPSATARPSSSLPAGNTLVTQVLPPPSGGSTAARLRRQWIVAASVIALGVFGVGFWFVFLRNHQNSPQAPVISASENIDPIRQPSSANTSQPLPQPPSVPEATVQTPGSNASGNVDPIPQPSAANPSQPSTQPASVPAIAAAPRVAESAQRDSAKSSRAKIAKAEPARATASPSLSANIPNPPPAAVPPVPPPVGASASSVPLNPPAPIAAPAPKRAEEDQARRAAEEQARRAAEEQAKRTADEQARRATEEQAKRTADEQAKRMAEEQAKTAREEKVRSAHAAELQSVARTLANYKSAYESKDVAALQEIWPSISKTSLDDIRGSFRDASEVKIDIRPVGDPEIAGDTATVVCDRNLRQVIRKKTFQASSRVRIALNRKGAGWVIASIDTVQ